MYHMTISPQSLCLIGVAMPYLLRNLLEQYHFPHQSDSLANRCCQFDEKNIVGSDLFIGSIIDWCRIVVLK